MSHEKINILLTIDKNYVQHCMVTLLSLFHNNPHTTFNVFVITDYIPEDDAKYLKSTSKKYNSELHILCIDIEKVKDFPIDTKKESQYSIAVYYRLFMADLLTNIDKIIYIDCDLLIRKEITSLWNINIDNHALAAIDDAVFTTIPSCKRLKIPVHYGYFNAGVMLVNLNYWRRKNITLKLFEYINNNRDRILLQDQDVLNAILYDSRYRLSVKWNMLECFYFDKNSIPQIYKKEFYLLRKDPTIIHWATNFKPWMYGSYNPYKKDYYYYLSFTKWNEFTPSYKEIRKKFTLFRFIMILLRLDKYLHMFFISYRNKKHEIKKHLIHLFNN